MIHAQSLRARLLLAAVSCCLLAMAAAALLPSTVRAAEAKGYGELTRFGEVGEGLGQLSEASTLALGVDPANNSVYVLDEYKPEEDVEVASKKVIKRFFRLQKFTATAGTYAESASVEFEETSPQGFLDPENGKPYRKPSVDGLVVDPAKERVYLLTTDFREATLSVDVEQNLNKEGVGAASTLYAFSTKETGKTLVPATGTKSGAVLTGPSEFETQSATKGRALLEPHGIAVDPSTHEVIVLAHVDDGGAKEDKVSSAEDHYVLQRINENGTFGTRYIDTSNKMKETAQQLGLEVQPVPTSPVVVSASGKEHVYVDFDGLAEIPYSFSSSEEPKILPLSANPQSGQHVEEGITEYPKKLEKEARESRVPQDGLLAASPEGTIYGMSESIRDEQPGGSGFHKGVLTLSGESGAVIGWTGGQASSGESLADNKCVIEPGGLQLAAQVAVGKEGKVFVLAPEFLRAQEEHYYPEKIEIIEKEVENPVTHEKEIVEEEVTIPAETRLEPREGAVKLPAVIELGPGGEGCPRANATGPVASQNGIEIKGEEAVRPGTEVKLSSKITQADATTVEWIFEDEGVKEPAVVQSYETLRTTKTFREPTIKHQFKTAGKYHITEKIYSDDLETGPLQAVYAGGVLTSPTITLTRTTLNVSTPLPNAQFSYPSTVKVGEVAEFESLSTDPNSKSAEPLEYVWNFGDGSAETPPSQSKTVKHTYTAAGVYKVKLTVKDQLGLVGSVEKTITVESSGGGGGCTTDCGGGGCVTNCGATTTTTTTTTTTPPKETPEPKQIYNVAIPTHTLSVSSSGAVSIKIDCAGSSSCAGTVTLRTLGAVAAKGKHKKAVLTLATGSFSAAGGQVKTVSLHLSPAARVLLAGSHGVLQAQAVVEGHDSSGAPHTTPSNVTLRLAKKHHH